MDCVSKLMHVLCCGGVSLAFVSLPSLPVVDTVLLIVNSHHSPHYCPSHSLTALSVYITHDNFTYR